MRRLEHGALAVILAAAALLRFAGLGQDLRRGPPTPDEWENFVGPVRQMWDARSPDPNVHGGYPGFFNWIAFLPMGVGLRLDGEAGACLAGRALVAAFGTLNVLLLFLLVRPNWGAAAALVGAALLASSRSEVSEGRFITPDVLVVSAFFALALAAQARPPGSLWPGVFAGLGTAIKYSGVLLFPAVAAEIVSRRRWTRLLPAMACGALAFAVAAPFALLWRRDQKRGVGEFASYYFAPLMGGRLFESATRQVGEVLSWVWTNLGPVAAALALLCVLARPRRPLAAPAAVVLASLCALALAGQVYPRHVLLASAAATVLSAAGYAAVGGRLPRWAGALLAVAALAVPSWRGTRVALGYTRPTPLDAAAAWIEGQGRPLRVATSLERLRLEGPIEVRSAALLWEWPAEALAHYDLVVAPLDVAGRLRGAATVRSFADPRDPGGAILVLRATRPPERRWPSPARVSATAPGAERAWDGHDGTAWTAPPGAGWVQAEWDESRALHAIEVVAAPGEGHWPQRLAVMGRRDGSWAPLRALPIRPTRARAQQPPHGQELVLDAPVAVDALRIERRAGGEWGLAEVRVYSLAE